MSGGWGHRARLAALAGLVVLAVVATGWALTRPEWPRLAAPTTSLPPASTVPASSSPPPTPSTMDNSGACPLGERRCPDPQVTPGAVIASEVGVCQTTYNPRKYLTAAAKRRVLAAYGLPPDTKVVEWDHLVARWAGGTSTSSNMWPILTDPDRDRKNRLGLRLYAAICRGDVRGVPGAAWAACGQPGLTLDCARQMMREFWRWW